MNKEFIRDFKVHPLHTTANFFGYGTAGSNIFLWPNPDATPLMCPAHLERIALE